MGLGFRGLGFGGLGFRGLGFRVESIRDPKPSNWLNALNLKPELRPPKDSRLVVKQGYYVRMHSMLFYTS